MATANAPAIIRPFEAALARPWKPVMRTVFQKRIAEYMRLVRSGKLDKVARPSEIERKLGLRRATRVPHVDGPLILMGAGERQLHYYILEELGRISRKEPPTYMQRNSVVRQMLEFAGIIKLEKGIGRRRNIVVLDKPRLDRCIEQRKIILPGEFPAPQPAIAEKTLAEICKEIKTRRGTAVPG